MRHPRSKYRLLVKSDDGNGMPCIRGMFAVRLREEGRGGEGGGGRSCLHEMGQRCTGIECAMDRGT